MLLCVHPFSGDIFTNRCCVVGLWSWELIWWSADLIFGTKHIISLLVLKCSSPQLKPKKEHDLHPSYITSTSLLSFESLVKLHCRLQRSRSWTAQQPQRVQRQWSRRMKELHISLLTVTASFRCRCFCKGTMQVMLQPWICTCFDHYHFKLWLQLWSG